MLSKSGAKLPFVTISAKFFRNYFCKNSIKYSGNLRKSHRICIILHDQAIFLHKHTENIHIAILSQFPAVCCTFVNQTAANTSKMKILVTGAAGFIGSKLSFRLAEADHAVIGIDNLNDSYDTRFKLARLKWCGIESGTKRFIDGLTRQSTVFPNYSFIRMDISDRGQVTQLFLNEKFDVAINLAGQSGLTGSIADPYAFIDSNLVGFMNILENCRACGVGHLIYASSSSVYGTDYSNPSNERLRTDSPMSLNAATKKADELIAHSYSQLYGLPTTGLRFFTVFGPWSRPDTVSMIFATDISRERPCVVFGNENASRDFIYIDDAVEAILHAMKKKPGTDGNGIPFRIYNVGSSICTKLSGFITLTARMLGKEAKLEYQPARRGRIVGECADMSKMESELAFRPSTELTDGLKQFTDWFTSPLNPL